MRLRLFALLTLCGFVIFALTMTFVPLLPNWVNNTARALLLLIFAWLWRIASKGQRLTRFRPVFFAYFTAVLSLSAGFYLADPALKFFRLTTQTPHGIAVAKFLQSFFIVIVILVTTKLFGEDLASLYLRTGRVLLGLGVGLLGAAVCLVLALPQLRTFGAARLLPLIPWIVLFVASNAFMEELLFRGLFLGRYEGLMGSGLAVLSTALAFTLAHMQVAYAPNLVVFLAVLLALSIAWGGLMQKSGSIWGSTLFHAGADLLIILPIFRSLGAA